MDNNLDSYKDIQQQIFTLQKRAEAARKIELASAIKEAKRLITTYGLTANDLGLAPTAKSASKASKKPSKTKTSKKSAGDRRSAVAPKYRDPASGKAWTGRGKKPTWLTALLNAGASLESFKI